MSHWTEVAFDNHSKILNFLVFAIRDRQIPIGFRHRKSNGEVRVVRPTHRVVAERGGLLRYWCPDRNAWRSASPGSLIDVSWSPEVDAVCNDVGIDTPPLST